MTLLQHGPGAERVARELERRPLMSWINLGEVLYILTRRRGSEEAEETVRDLRRTLSVELPSETLIRRAAGIKAAHRMAYADAFAAATAVVHGAQLWTADPELLVADAPWRPVDIRS